MTQPFNLRSLSILTIPAIVFLMLLGSGDSAFGQGNQGGGDGGGNIDPSVLQGGNNGGNVGGEDSGADTGGGGDGETGDGEIDSVEPIRLEYAIPDRRNQGFVGATAPGLDDQADDSVGFVGPLTDEPDAETAEGRSIGGDTNAGIGNRNATTTSVELQENGFSVQRKGIRTRLRPAFASPKMPSHIAERRFQSRMTRQPVVRQFGQGVTVTIGNKTAVLTGVVASNTEREIIKRQLRLEPGVYKIDDRTVVAQ